MVDNTQLVAFQRCPRQFHYLYNLQLNPGGGLEAEFGSLIHSAVGAWYLGKAMDLKALYFNSEIPSLVDAKTLTSRYFKPKIYSFDSFEWAVEGYAERFAQDLEDWQVAGVEEKFIYEEWLSKLDVRLVSQSNNQVYGVELKTSTSEHVLETREIDRQFIGEQVAANLNGLFVTLIQLGEKGHNFHRELVQTPAWLKAEWLTEIQFDVKQFNEARERNIWPKRAREACFAYGRWCPFLKICEGQESVENWPKKDARGYLK